MVGAPLTAQERDRLERALALATRAHRGAVSPNPLVGAVIARGGQLLGEGWHAELGGLHAERAALEDCRRRGEDPAGATMYVTLEPCTHHGRQPPCTEAILDAGIASVVIAAEDPSAKASGRGPGMLRDGGVEVAFAGAEVATAARLQNQPFRKHARTGLPLVSLKMALSLDGRAATAAGDSRWISGEQSRELAHRWRAEADAIAVGIGTVLADDPLLTARSHGVRRQPLRVVFDSAARLPLDSRLVRTVEQAPLLVIASPQAERVRLAALEAAGSLVTIAGGATRAEGVRAALDDLGRRGVTNLFLEGGPTLAGAFAAIGEIDEMRLFLAPIVVGGGPPALAGEGPERINEAARALAVEVERVAEDVLVRARMREW